MIKKNKPPRTAQIEKCPICEGNKIKHLFTSPDRLHGVSGDFNYYVCCDCQTVFQNPMVIPEDLYLCYPQDYYTHSSEFASKKEINVAELLKNSNHGLKGKLRQAVVNSIKGKKSTNIIEKIGFLLAKSRRLRERTFFGVIMDELLPNNSESLKALEIGCGSGILLNKLRSVGWDVEGIEWDEKAAQGARKNTESFIRVGNFLELDLPESNYNLIVLHHVFEHLTAPVEAIKKMKGLLKKDGKIVLIYPNPDSLGAKYYKDYWFPWEVPRHLILVSPKTLKKIAEKLNFKVNFRTTAKYADYFSANSRSYLKGQPIDELNPNKNLKDEVLMRLENFLIAIGFAAGDEVIIVLQKVDS